MSKYVDMSGFDEFTDNLEDYVNKQGCTLGEQAERLQQLLYCINFCYLHGVATDSQAKQMMNKFMEKFKKALREIEGDE